MPCTIEHHTINQSIMKTVSLPLVVAALLFGTQPVIARMVTLLVQGANKSDELTITAEEVLQVRTYFDVAYTGNCNDAVAFLEVQRGSNTLIFNAKHFGTTCGMRVPDLLIVGPATAKLRTGGVPGNAFATLEVMPEAFPPDRSLIIPSGPGGAAITLECSEDLVHWGPSTNGIYTNLPAAKFFRIKAERIP
jgi:hypothetical protein